MDRTCEKCAAPIPAKRLSVGATTCSHGCRQAIDKERYGLSVSLGTPSATTGAISELLACSYYLKRGFEVFRSVSPAAKCDLVVCKDGITLRVEVRTGYIRKRTGSLTWPAAPQDKCDEYAIVVHTERGHKLFRLRADGTKVETPMVK